MEELKVGRSTGRSGVMESVSVISNSKRESETKPRRDSRLDSLSILQNGICPKRSK